MSTARKTAVMVAIAAVALGIGIVVARGRRLRPEPQAQLFPPDAAGRWERIALYVGIDIYPHDSIANLAAPLNDVEELRALLRQRYGFSRDAVLTGKHATRAAIGTALRGLIGQVRKAVARDVHPVVLLFFAGHGSLVADNDEMDERHATRPKDSTWVAYDSDSMANNDVRDDDVNRVIGELDRLGATVVYLTDSCHSGSSFRGGGADGPSGTVRGTTRRKLHRGPETSLFPELAWKADSLVASYVACGDSEAAQERRLPDREGRVVGCFTHSVINVLRASQSTLSYDEFGRRVEARFRQDWPETITEYQQPLHVVHEALRGRALFTPRRR